MTSLNLIPKIVWIEEMDEMLLDKFIDKGNEVNGVVLKDIAVFRSICMHLHHLFNVEGIDDLSEWLYFNETKWLYRLTFLEGVESTAHNLPFSIPAPLLKELENLPCFSDIDGNCASFSSTDKKTMNLVIKLIGIKDRDIGQLIEDKVRNSEEEVNGILRVASNSNQMLEFVHGWDWEWGLTISFCLENPVDIYLTNQCLPEEVQNELFDYICERVTQRETFNSDEKMTSLAAKLISSDV